MLTNFQALNKQKLPAVRSSFSATHRPGTVVRLEVCYLARAPIVCSKNNFKFWI